MQDSLTSGPGLPLLEGKNKKGKSGKTLLEEEKNRERMPS